MKYGSWQLGQIEALINRLGERNARRLLNCRSVTVDLGLPDHAVITTDRVWKTIKTGGTHIKTVDEFYEAKRAGTFGEDFHSSLGRADKLVERLVAGLASEQTEVDLVRMTVEEIAYEEGMCGSNDGADYDHKIVWRARLRWGLDLCTLEDALQLRWQYPDQPKGEYLFIATEPIIDREGKQCLLQVAHTPIGMALKDGGPHPHDPDGYYRAQDEFVFRQSRKLAKPVKPKKTG